MTGTINRTTESLKQSAKDSVKDFLVQTFLGDNAGTTNVLHKYRTFNYIVTLAAVSQGELDSGAYRNKQFDYIIFQSHGKGQQGPIVPGGSKVLSEIQQFISTIGSGGDYDYDFLLQDLYIENYVSASKDFATNVRLKILEPYSADVFLGRMLTGLRLKGNTALNRSACFVMKIEFVGWRDDREYPEIIPYTTRYYPLIITDLKANLTSEGTVYEISAVPFNDTGRYTDVNVVHDSITVEGETVEDVLKDYEKKLNALSKEKATKAGFKPHQYKIVIADEKLKPNPGSEIGQAKMFDPLADEAKTKELKDRSGYLKIDERTKKIASNEGQKLVFTVPASIPISKGIDSIICDSKYVVEKIFKNFEGEYENGMVNWWRIQTVPRKIDDDPATNAPVNENTFFVVPRQVHWTYLASIFRPRDTNTVPADWEKNCIRNYEWYYTGNNRDILNFKINWETLYVRAITSNFAQGPDIGNRNVEGAEEDNKELNVAGGGSSVNVGTGMNGGSQGVNTGSSSSNKNTGVRSSGETNPAHVLARDINALLNFPYENINFEMEILGDPVWMGTQFVDIFNVGNPGDNITKDGNVAFKTKDPVVRVLAYSPKDFNRDGFLTASGSSDQDRKLSQWSSYYTVMRVESFFQNGVFKQKLYGVRRGDIDMSGVGTADASPKNNTYSFAGFGVKFS